MLFCDTFPAELNENPSGFEVCTLPFLFPNVYKGVDEAANLCTVVTVLALAAFNGIAFVVEVIDVDPVLESVFCATVVVDDGTVFARVDPRRTLPLTSGKFGPVAND